MRGLGEGQSGVMVALAINGVNYVPLDGDTLQTARDLGICMGDE